MANIKITDISNNQGNLSPITTEEASNVKGGNPFKYFNETVWPSLKNSFNEGFNDGGGIEPCTQ